MEAIILVGGLGTRLGRLTNNTPKPMLPIRGIPFLERFLEHLKLSGIERSILATGFKSEVIETYFPSRSSSLPEIQISFEETPLGTGGAISKALMKVDSKDIIVLNGDTFLNVDYSKLLNAHLIKQADITVASRYVNPANRYGVITYNQNGRVITFEEKGKKSNGYINAGVYVCKVESLREIFAPFGANPFSLEKDILTEICSVKKIYDFKCDGYFIDIGINDDYEKAQLELFTK